MEAENSYCSLRKPTEDVYTTTVQLQDRGASGGPTGRTRYVCPQSWMLFNSKCYLFSSNMLTWAEGLDGCRQNGAHLVIIESEQEQVCPLCLLGFTQCG
ncbi:CLC4E protein, partial [Polypterus senegalus]|nr:CLC4E protein [Polypterus senegalus]